MMRTLLILAAVATEAAAAAPQVSYRGAAPAPAEVNAATNGAEVWMNKNQCSLQGAESADSLLDSILFIWAAVERCGDPQFILDNNGVQIKGGTPILCSVDVSAAIESVNHMINFILKAVQTCGAALEGPHAKCGLAVGGLTESLAGIASKSSEIAAHCPKPTLNGDTITWNGDKNLIKLPHKFAHCVVDSKALIKSLFKAVMRIVSLKDNCQDNPQGRHCSRNILSVVGAFAEMGEYVSGAVGHCSMPTNEDANCASGVLGLLRELGKLSRAGMAIKTGCGLSDSQRLFLESDEDEIPEAAPGNNFMNLGLAAFIPLTAVLSFVAGRRMAKGRPDLESQRDLQPFAEE